MNIVSVRNGASLTLAPEGRLDTVSAPQLEEAIFGPEGGAETLILDFEKLSYISSAGLRVLLMAQKKLSVRGGMKLIRVSEPILEILETTGFTDILTIE